MPVTKKSPVKNSNLVDFKTKIAEYDESPYCSGTAILNPNAASLFYSTTEGMNARIVNFAKPCEADVETLAKACQPATFGLNQQDVLDESYRKAGKMDADKISTQFTPFDLGMNSAIEEYLLQGRKHPPLRVEFYKLNVYGPGAFFKSHVDTPRSDAMFGSLVVVLPTVHVGGALVLRHNSQTWTFESNKLVDTSPPKVAFVAFFSDVEHEVLPVTTGYRVTLTYNLYFSKSTEIKTTMSLKSTGLDDDLKASFLHLLRDPKFLPDGGDLGFGLSHKYPVDPETTELSDVLKWLKGSDAGARDLCKSLGLDASAQVLYRCPELYGEKTVFCLLKDFCSFKNSMPLEEGVLEYLADDQYGPQGTKVYDPEEEKNDSGDKEPLVWVKSPASVNSFESSYLAYGNEASLDCVYGEVCLVVSIPSHADRKYD